MKIPQDSTTFMIELTYEQVSPKLIDIIKLTDKDVAKCTYWQSPVFASQEEAKTLGAMLLNIKGPVYFTDTLTQRKNSLNLDIKVFTDKCGLMDFDMTRFVNRVFENDFSFDYYLFAFRRKYGGIYWGLLESDTANVEYELYPYQIFGDIGDYEMYNLLGTTFEQDLSNIREFINYNFELDRKNKAFRIFQENSKYYINLLSEEPKSVDSLVEQLITKGYRAGSSFGSRFDMLENIATFITSPEKLPELAGKLNLYADSLNFVMENDGLFIFFTTKLDDQQKNRIMNDLHDLTDKQHLVSFSFDCYPLKSPFPQAPFSTPVLVFLNFSEDAGRIRVDSIGVIYP